MSMFCSQCQETAKGSGCTIKGVCGKTADVANLQDLLVYTLKGISVIAESAEITKDSRVGKFIASKLFTTVTNVNFTDADISSQISEAIALRDELKAQYSSSLSAELHDCVTFSVKAEDYQTKSLSIGVLSTANEDVRSLRELLVGGLKGIAAYAHHASVLGKEDPAVFECLIQGLASTTKDLSVDEMIGFVMSAGAGAVATMAALDSANTETYGNPELTTVKTGVGNKPGILISGHDLKDMKMLLDQTKDTGVDVYTHSEMLPAHYYPEFKKYDNLVGNYGNSWWSQGKEFASFNGPILMTTNCIVPVKDTYKDRIFTTGTVGYPGVSHIEEDANGNKDFSKIIEIAKKSQAPVELEDGEIVGGFAHAQVFALADKVVDAVKSGAIKRFIVMAGCDARQKGREYFTEVAKELPDNTIILTAGCAKFRYNKLELGDIGGIPRVLDAGQCNDCYSLAIIALKLKEIFEFEDINDLPISFDIAWYEQKAVAVLLALLHLGVKGIRLGPTLPGFLSPTVAKVLVDTFDIKLIGDVKEDVEAMMAGK